MPLISYLCECGLSVSKFFRQPIEAKLTLKCIGCGKESKKQLSAPNSKSIVVVDNGVQARKVEVDLEIVKDIEARSTKDFKSDDKTKQIAFQRNRQICRNARNLL